ncbi:MAG: hypothetical protein J0H82_00205 [Alphaproteobacteria bacterium]|jgi:hypothetical protein|nr:hypothetical protein [Alphaproteobacteria bacterium]
MAESRKPATDKRPVASAEGPADPVVPTVDAGANDWLSRGLRDLFQETAEEPLPDSFLKLIEELERKNRN